MNVLHAHFLCVPCRTENNISTVHSVILYFSICLSLSLVLSLCSFSSSSVCFLSTLCCRALFSLSLPLCWLPPDACVYRTWTYACQKCWIAFVHSKHAQGAGCLVIAVHLLIDIHTNTGGQSTRAALVSCLCQWGAAGCHNEQSPHKETSDDKRRLLNKTWVTCVSISVCLCVCNCLFMWSVSEQLKVQCVRFTGIF